MGYPIGRYLRIRAAFGPGFDPSGERLAFRMDTTGSPQVWYLEGPQQWPEQLTFGEERATFLEWSPTRGEFVYGSDRGGNERTQFLLMDVERGVERDLTATPQAKHRWGGWSSDGDRFVFASNRRDDAVFDVYIQDRTASATAAEMVLEGDGWLTVGDWSPNDRYIVLVESRSSFDQQLAVLDVASGERIDLTPAGANVRYWDPQWSPAGDALYVATDRDRDTTVLARLSVPDGDLDVVETGGEWNVDGVAVHSDTGRIIYTRNVDGYTDLTVGTLRDPMRITVDSRPVLPGDVAGGIGFTPEGDRFAIGVNGPIINTNVVVVECESGTITRWTRASTAGIPTDRFVEPELVRVESFDGERIPAYLTTPDDADSAPLLVDIHGGPESQRRPAFSGVKQFFVDHGYAYLEPNVRGSTGYGRRYAALDDQRRRLDSVADLIALVDWAIEKPSIDPNRVVPMGGSYGGFMVLSAMTEYPDRWAAGISIVGIANFITFLENTGSWRRSLREAEYGSLEHDRAFLKRISPINNIERIDAPLFVVHGSNDPRVPVGEAEQIAREASEHVPVETLIFEDEGHGITKLDNRIETYEQILAFLDRHVGGP